MSTRPYTPDLAGSGQVGICVQCGKGPTPEGHDGCLGTLPERVVMNACCGHGRDSSAYIQYWDGSRIGGVGAIREQQRLKEGGMSTREDAERRYAQIEGERDYHQRRAERLEEERDAVQRLADCRARQRDELVAHVERLNSVVLHTLTAIEDGNIDEAPFDLARDVFNSDPTTSLARRDAEKQAEAVEMVRIAMRVHGLTEAEELVNTMAQALHRHVEEPTQ